MSKGTRPLAARIGIAALNLPLPGLGLLRLGRWRAAAAIGLIPFASLLVLLAYYAATPSLSFAAYAISAAIPIAGAIGAIVASAAIGWRGSRRRAESLRWWSRWYGLAGIFLLGILTANLLVEALHRFYKPFYLPADSMAPTLLVDDRLIAAMRAPAELRRGDILLFDVGGSMYIKRVAALPGDRIAMRGGTVILNGRPVEQHFVRTEQVAQMLGPASARRLAEQFPGEAQPHEIYDFGPGPFDDLAEQRVAPDHVFVLGDNRDHSADSRVPRDEMGVEQVPLADIRGRALFYTWGPSGRMGESLTR